MYSVTGSARWIHAIGAMCDARQHQSVHHLPVSCAVEPQTRVRNFEYGRWS